MNNKQMAACNFENRTRARGPGEPECITWSVSEVAEWIESLGFKAYKVVPMVLS